MLSITKANHFSGQNSFIGKFNMSSEAKSVNKLVENISNIATDKFAGNEKEAKEANARIKELENEISATVKNESKRMLANDTGLQVNGKTGLDAMNELEEMGLSLSRDDSGNYVLKGRDDASDKFSVEKENGIITLDKMDPRDKTKISFVADNVSEKLVLDGGGDEKKGKDEGDIFHLRGDVASDLTVKNAFRDNRAAQMIRGMDSCIDNEVAGNIDLDGAKALLHKSMGDFDSDNNSLHGGVIDDFLDYFNDNSDKFTDEGKEFVSVVKKKLSEIPEDQMGFRQDGGSILDTRKKIQSFANNCYDEAKSNLENA